MIQKYLPKMGKQSGFTIVELIVVIVVIAILASIAIIGYNWLRNDAIDSKLEADAQSVIKIMKLRQTKFGSVGLSKIDPAPTTNQELRQMYNLGDFGGNIMIQAYVSDDDDGLHNLSDADFNYDIKDKVLVTISSSDVTITRWNNQKRVFIITKISDSNAGESVWEWDPSITM